MLMTNAELEVFLLDVVRRVAGKSRVADMDLKGSTELMADIRQQNASLFAVLQDFLIAYVNWYYFHYELEQLGLGGECRPGNSGTAAKAHRQA